MHWGKSRSLIQLFIATRKMINLLKYCQVANAEELIKFQYLKDLHFPVGLVHLEDQLDLAVQMVLKALVGQEDLKPLYLQPLLALHRFL